ncbi:MAG: LysR family transcriptional regulator [Myxococcota bacterium]|nr:LysR family transcriptional regulator [Deltaproteobacteria bacterium]MDQ3333628.1 LysR family transcriptional regulator [Myxococcota bacterium]
MLNYNHLYYFHVAAIEGTVAGAAQRLGVTQPTVSEQLRTLERALRVSLFERQVSGLKLTESGRLAFEHTSMMFQAGERLLQALGHDPAVIPRTLRVGISGAVGRVTSTDFMMPLLALEGSVPSIRGGDGVDLIRELRANELDLVLIETEPPTAARQGLEMIELDRVTLVAVAPPGLKPAADWQNLGIVQYRATSALRWDIETYLSEHGLRPTVVGETDDALFLLEAAARGGYVTFVPRSVARDAIATKRLTTLATVTTTHAGVFALYQDGDTADLARRAVHVLLEQVRAMNELEASTNR